MNTETKIIYLDNHSTTPLDSRVLQYMMPYLTKEFGNASSIDHKYGYSASTAVETAREDIAKLVHAKQDEIVFTSGATESNNLALIGIMQRYTEKGDHLITSVTEHEAVLSTAKYLESIGKDVTYLPVNSKGIVNPDDIKNAITDKTVLVSIMSANNEIGTIPNIQSIGEITRENDILFHTDAAQAVGHIPIDVNKMNIDIMSFSAHKMYGPKGIGGLYIRGIKPRVKLEPIIRGGGQERNIRSGTLNVPGIVGFGRAASIALKEMSTENTRIKRQSDIIRKLIDDAKLKSLLNGDENNRLAGNLNLCFPGIEGKAIINFVSKSIAISAGSACTTQSVEPSHVIMALGYGEERAHSSIRIGIGRFNTFDDVEFAAEKIIDAVKNIEKSTDMR